MRQRRRQSLWGSAYINECRGATGVQVSHPLCVCVCVCVCARERVLPTCAAGLWWVLVKPMVCRAFCLPAVQAVLAAYLCGLHGLTTL